MPFLTDSCQMKLHHAATYGPLQVAAVRPPVGVEPEAEEPPERRCEIGSTSALAVTFAVPLISTTLLVSPPHLCVLAPCSSLMGE